MSSPRISAQRDFTLLPPLPETPRGSATSGTIELSPLKNAKLIAAHRSRGTSATVQPGPNKSIARTLSAPFRAIRDAFCKLGDLIAENQAARKQQVLAKKVEKVEKAAANFAKAFEADAGATIENKLEMGLALMEAARRLNPDEPAKAAVEAFKENMPELTRSELRQLSMELYAAASRRDADRILAANGQASQAYLDPGSAIRQMDAFMGALRGAHIATPEEQQETDVQKDKLKDTVCGTFGQKQAEDMEKVQTELSTYLAEPGVNTGNVLRAIKLPVAAMMTRFLDANDSPEYRGGIVATLLRAATLDTPLPLDKASSGPKLVPALLGRDQVSATTHMAVIRAHPA